MLVVTKGDGTSIGSLADCIESLASLGPDSLVIVAPHPSAQIAASLRAAKAGGSTIVFLDTPSEYADALASDSGVLPRTISISEAAWVLGQLRPASRSNTISPLAETRRE